MDRITLAYRVEVDIPDPLPITDDELALIETHLGAIIAAMVENEVTESELPRQ